jgi:hypothetical protein
MAYSFGVLTLEQPVQKVRGDSHHKVTKDKKERLCYPWGPCGKQQRMKFRQRIYNQYCSRRESQQAAEGAFLSAPDLVNESAFHSNDRVLFYCLLRNFTKTAAPDPLARCEAA